MSVNSILLMEEALDLAYLELDLLQKEESDEAAHLAAQRKAIIEKAWINKTDDQLELLKEQLLTMSKVQELLSETAHFLADKLRTEIKCIKQESQRMSGYSFTISDKNNAGWMSRIG